MKTERTLRRTMRSSSLGREVIKSQSCCISSSQKVLNIMLLGVMTILLLTFHEPNDLAVSTRFGSISATIVDEEGQEYPTEDIHHYDNRMITDRSDVGSIPIMMMDDDNNDGSDHRNDHRELQEVTSSGTNSNYYFTTTKLGARNYSITSANPMKVRYKFRSLLTKF
jgi:hypothetical protein